MKYQWKKIRVAAVILGLVLLYCLLDMSSDLGLLDVSDIDNELGRLNVFDAKEEWSSLEVFGVIGEDILLYLGKVIRGVSVYSRIVWLAAVFLGFSLFDEYGDDRKMSLFRSLPYTRRGMWRRSCLMGSGMISVGYLVFALAAVVLYGFSYSAAHDAYLYSPAYEILCSIDTLGNALMYILEEWVIALGVFAVAVFARMAVGHVLAALLLLAGVLTAPSLLLSDLGYRILLRRSSLSDGIVAMGNGMKYLAGRMLMTTAHLDRYLVYCMPFHSYDRYSGSVIVKYSTYERGTLILWAGIAVAALACASRLTGKETVFSRIGRTPLIENLFILFAGLYLPLLVMAGMSGGIRKSLPVMILVFVMVEGTMIYFFKGKRREKYEKWNTWRGGSNER